MCDEPTIAYTLATGSPADGLELHGVFKTSDEAIDYACNSASFQDGWWLMPIYSVKKEDAHA